MSAKAVRRQQVKKSLQQHQSGLGELRGHWLSLRTKRYEDTRVGLLHTAQSTKPVVDRGQHGNSTDGSQTSVDSKTSLEASQEVTSNPQVQMSSPKSRRVQLRKCINQVVKSGSATLVKLRPCTKQVGRKIVWAWGHFRVVLAASHSTRKHTHQAEQMTWIAAKKPMSNCSYPFAIIICAKVGSTPADLPWQNRTIWWTKKLKTFVGKESSGQCQVTRFGCQRRRWVRRPSNFNSISLIWGKSAARERTKAVMRKEPCLLRYTQVLKNAMFPFTKPPTRHTENYHQPIRLPPTPLTTIWRSCMHCNMRPL